MTWNFHRALLFVAAIATLSVATASLAQDVQYRSETTDLLDNPIATIPVNTPFLFRVFVEDIRPQPTGVFSAFVDVLYDQTLVVPTGAIIHSSVYNAAPSGDLSTLGMMDEVGGVDGIVPLGDGENLVFTVPMMSLQLGTAVFDLNPADDMQLHPTLLFGGVAPVPDSDILFLPTTLRIVPTPTSSGLCAVAMIALPWLRRWLLAPVVPTNA